MQHTHQNNTHIIFECGYLFYSTSTWPFLDVLFEKSCFVIKFDYVLRLLAHTPMQNVSNAT